MPIPGSLGIAVGKDSTTALQLVWYALADLPVEQRTKPIFIISTDTRIGHVGKVLGGSGGNSVTWTTIFSPVAFSVSLDALPSFVQFARLAIALPFAGTHQLL